ncbi:HAUS augmin-like complex subunit 1 [Mortierella sp. AM989]|nr:HAUS augmin-like complex subunit 1 [Mortierella sp. AM989]
MLTRRFFKIEQWLQSKYLQEEIPKFERTRDTASVLLELIQLNESQDANARQAIFALQNLSSSYQNEDIKLKENIHILGLHKDNLSPNSQSLLSQLTDLAMLLGISETTLASYHQSLAHLKLDIIQYSQKQRQQSGQLLMLEKYQARAQGGLGQLLELKRRLRAQRETDRDIEQRTRRRSTELSRIRAGEDKEKLQHMLQMQQNNGLDVAMDEVTLAHLESKHNAVIELEQQLRVQEKTLSAYQEIPPDYELARLKMKEATLQLDHLTAEHESLLTELANDL